MRFLTGFSIVWPFESVDDEAVMDENEPTESVLSLSDEWVGEDDELEELDLSPSTGSCRGKEANVKNNAHHVANLQFSHQFLSLHSYHLLYDHLQHGSYLDLVFSVCNVLSYVT